MNVYLRALILAICTQALSAQEGDGAILISRAGGRSLDGVAKEGEFNLGLRLAADLGKVRAFQTRLTFSRHQGNRDDPVFTPSGPRQGLSQSDSAIGCEVVWRQGVEWGSGLEFRRDYLKLNAWPLLGLRETRMNYDRIWIKVFVANLPTPSRLSPLVRAEIGFTPQHGSAVGGSTPEATMKALAPDFHLTLSFGLRFALTDR